MSETTLVDIAKIVPNIENPRTIKDDNFRKLVQSIKEFPEMASIRPLVVNTDYVILGGNEEGWEDGTAASN